jgi:protein phosphatase methylesterase 1
MDHHGTNANLVANPMPEIGQDGYHPHAIKPHLPPSNFSAGVQQLKNQYDPLPWTDFFDTTEMIEDQVPLYKAGTQGHLHVCLHGAGHSAMSFAAFASQMKSDSIVYAFDHRGHGTHTCHNETELSQETLIGDTLRVLEFVHQRHPDTIITLVGHSMGGSIAVKTARRIET